jgi:cytochrome bd ubiquinol oxidase subunit II
MSLAVLWFCVITVFWLGYLFLEGFDFGVGMLLAVLGRDDRERRVLINTIGPLWDGNEVWLIVAIGATFAAFPAWYAGLLSAAYLPVLLILLGLIGRGVAFEYRGKVDSQRWRRTWDRIIVTGSLVPSLGIGLLLSSTFLGLPLDAAGNRDGSPFAALRWDTGLGALAFAGFALVHGAAFIALKTEGSIRRRARVLGRRIGPVVLLPLIALTLLVQLERGSAWLWPVFGLAILAGVAAVARLRAAREGQAFALLGLMLACAVVTLFGALYPDVLPSTVDDAFSLTVAGAASSPYTLGVMSWVGLIGLPVVLIYQGWTYWVFRKRVGTQHIPAGH